MDEEEKLQGLYLECLKEGWKELQEILIQLGKPLSEEETPERLAERTWNLYEDDLLAHLDGQLGKEARFPTKEEMIEAIRDNSESLFGTDIRKYFE